MYLQEFEENRAWYLLEAVFQHQTRKSGHLIMELAFQAWRRCHVDVLALARRKAAELLSCQRMKQRSFTAWARLRKELMVLEATSDVERISLLCTAWRQWHVFTQAGPLVSWKRFVQSGLQKLRHQAALESLVDALDARASRAQNSQKEATSGVMHQLLTQMTFIAWKSWWQTEAYCKEMGQVRQALASTESCAKVMLRDVVTDLHSNYDSLGCMLIFRSWYSHLVSQKLWSCQRGFSAWARLRKEGIPEVAADLETVTLLSAAWRQWHLFTKTGPLVSWRRLVQSALQRWSRQVALESLVDALDARAARWQLETYNRRPALLFDVLAEMWSAWRALVGEGGTGCLARWRRLVLAFLRKERHQAALESLVDALDARASRAQNSQKEATSGVMHQLLTQMTFIAWKSWWQTEAYCKEMGQVRQALASTESCAKVMLRDVVTDLHSNYDSLGCMLIFRSWYSHLVSQKLWSCQRGFSAWARLRKEGIPEVAADLETVTLLSAAWRQWHLFTKTGPLVSWRRLVQSALQRWSRQVALESLVDALDARAARWQLETYNRRPALLYDVLAEMWSAWRALVGEGGTGCLARWRRLVLAFLRKERHQVALESLVDVLAAEAGKDFDLLEIDLGPESPMANLSDLGLVFRCWRLAAGHHFTQTRYKSALTELKLRDANWSQLQAVFLQWGLVVRSMRRASIRKSFMRGLETAMRLQQCCESQVQRQWLLHCTFWTWRSWCAGSRPNHLQDYVFQTTSDLSPIHPSEGRPQLSMEESMLSSTFLSPKQPEEEEVPTDLVEHGGQPEEEQAPPTVFQPFITPTSHTRTDSADGPIVDRLDLFDQFDLKRPEPVPAREEEIQRRIYLKRHFFLEGVMRRCETTSFVT